MRPSPSTTGEIESATSIAWPAGDTLTLSNCSILSPLRNLSSQFGQSLGRDPSSSSEIDCPIASDDRWP